MHTSASKEAEAQSSAALVVCACPQFPIVKKEKRSKSKQATESVGTVFLDM
jgi:hypothetical protein